MHQTTSHLHRLAACGFAVAGLAAGASADLENPGAHAYLSTDEAVIGGTVRVELRSPLVGSQAVLAFGLTPTPVVLGGSLPVLKTGIPFSTPSGLIGADGRLAVDIPIAPAFPPGVEVFVQGAVISTSPVLQFHASQPTRLAPGGPAATYSAGAALPATTITTDSFDVDWADINKDGFDDVIVANDGDGAVISILMNQAGAGFVEEAALRLPLSAQISARSLELGDVDNDGDLDLFLGAGVNTLTPGENQLLRNDGFGFFSTVASFPVGSGVPIDAEFGDVDSDGDLDLITASVQDADHPGEISDGVALYVNLGGGDFIQETTFSLLGATDPHTSGGSVSLGDVDNDGDLDLFVARADTSGGGAQNNLLVNSGNGVFTDITAISIPAKFDNSFEAELVDVNGDGLLDIIVANSITTVDGNHYLLNLGVSGGTGQVAFNDVSTTLMPASFGPATDLRLGIEPADIDGDGDMDLFVAIHQLFDAFGQLDGDAVLLLNQGGAQGGMLGAFDVDPSFVVGGGGFVCNDVGLGDADGDGDLDLYLVSIGDLFGIFPPADVLLLNNL